jgi:hypothetical protein
MGSAALNKVQLELSVAILISYGIGFMESMYCMKGACFGKHLIIRLVSHMLDMQSVHLWQGPLTTENNSQMQA